MASSSRLCFTISIRSYVYPIQGFRAFDDDATKYGLPDEHAVYKLLMSYNCLKRRKTSRGKVGD